MNIINSSGVLALSTRLQRLAEQLRKDGALFYKSYGIEFEPKWFPVILTLSHRPLLSVIELATEIGYTHPSTISLLKELEKEKLIRSKKDKTDERKRLLELTQKGIELVATMQPIWKVIESALDEIASNNDNLLRAIDQAEEALVKQSFLQRAMALKIKE
ncbi:MarR family winged helix-turn-helix transcriptional regulator [Pedobacter jamesrossensis]|uniref:MarR family winged helix-turn-helix transcriptional regulator n=1 Tax=Pedobacter jamesrossensis TaxID=1908238 RepID=A0ABV8NFY9_9SPHI